MIHTFVVAGPGGFNTVTGSERNLVGVDGAGIVGASFTAVSGSDAS